MKFLNSLKTISPLEIFLFIIITFYILFSVQTPPFLIPFIDSPLGMITLFIITICLFVYTNPILGVLFIFASYELIRRSSIDVGLSSIIEYTPTQRTKDIDLQNMNPPQPTSLEEEIINIRAPIGKGQEVEFMDSNFKPIADKTLSGISMV